jgi:hypothetical protein
MRARGAAWAEAASCRGRTRGRARVWLKVRDGPDGRGPPGGEGDRGADWAAGSGEGEAKQLAGLGRAVEIKKRAAGPGLAGGRGEKGKKKEREWVSGAAGRRKRKGRKRRKWAGPKEKEGEKKKNIQMHLNLKFKFKWKTSNRTMQCGMKCTRPIFSYIPFYD